MTWGGVFLCRWGRKTRDMKGRECESEKREEKLSRAMDAGTVRLLYLHVQPKKQQFLR